MAALACGITLLLIAKTLRRQILVQDVPAWQPCYELGDFAGLEKVEEWRVMGG